MKAHAALLLSLLFSVSGCLCDSARVVSSYDPCPKSEACNGVDDTCDGVVDEGCPCTAGQTQACGSAVGACREGTQGCDGASGWSPACVGAVLPGTEVCDGADNDCDGSTDEDDVCVAPVVTCPAPGEVPVNRVLHLAASAEANGSPIASVGWSLVSSPAGATGTPKPAAAANTAVLVDALGEWKLQFCATDEAGAMSCCESTFEAVLPCTQPPAPPVSTACETSWDGRPIVQFDPVPSGLVYELVREGEVLATATEGHNHVRPSARIDPGGDAPGAEILLGVRACRVDDPICCSAESTATVRVISECTTPVPASATNLILSEYVVNGEGACSGTDCDCQNGEAIELTNLTNCPVSLDGFHFAYRNDNASSASFRWMNFGPADVVPPRGVYVAMRNQQLATTCAASLGTPRPGLYGLTISALAMQGDNLCSGWFKNGGGGQSELRVAPGAVSSGASLDFTPGNAITRIAPYQSAPGTCQSTGFDAIDSCGNVVGGQTPTDTLSPNQLGRLWHPCDAVIAPSPACARD